MTKSRRNIKPDHAKSPESGELPSRKVMFPSNKEKITRYFYNVLILFFLSLVVGLAVWGFKHAQ